MKGSPVRIRASAWPLQRRHRRLEPAGDLLVQEMKLLGVVSAVALNLVIWGLIALVFTVGLAAADP